VNYEQTLDFMFSALPMYQRMGKSAFKKDLSNTIALCKYLGDPQNKFKSIHIAGTNGKGSTSHMVSSMLQSAGYKVGLYTSPHLKDFRERIRVSGTMIAQSTVIDFIEEHKAFIEQLQPSFFEMTVALAFDVFAKEKVDIAVIEVGLGGRLDSTNVISPELSVITNIGYDHMDMLGDTLPKIAMEKAGIIKPNVPVVIGEYQTETAQVFENIADERGAKLLYAKDLVADNDHKLPVELKGNYQKINKLTAIAAIRMLNAQDSWSFDLEQALHGLNEIVEQTGLKGRWQRLNEIPLTICDTGHNKEGFQFIIDQLIEFEYRELWMVLGFVNDKNVSDLLEMLPSEVNLVFTEAQVPRAMKINDLRELVKKKQLRALFVNDVNQAIDTAKSKAAENDLIFVGGSTFVVAEIVDL